MSNASGKRRPPKGRPASTFMVNINRPPEGEDKSKLDTPNEADTSVDEVVSNAAKAAVKLSPDALKPVYERSPEKLITPEPKPPEPSEPIVPARPEKLFQAPISTSTDDEEPIFSPKDVAQPKNKEKPQPNGAINVSLAISLPHGRDFLPAIKRQGSRLYVGLKSFLQSVERRFLALNKRLQAAIAIIIVLMVGWGAVAALHSHHNDGDGSQATAVAKAIAVEAPSKTPSTVTVTSNPLSADSTPTAPPPVLAFTPVVPAGESQLAKLDTTTHYNSGVGSYTFSDLFVGFPITVSEQQVPSGYASVAAAVSKVASSVHATKPIATASGIMAYMGTDSKGKETIVYSVKHILVLIQTTYKVTAAQWPDYLNSLQ